MDYIDISDGIGPLFPTTDVKAPMYSYNGPAYTFWNGAAQALVEHGLSEKQAIEWLQSKNARWLMDAYAQEIEALGKTLVQKYLGLAKVIA